MTINALRGGGRGENVIHQTPDGVTTRDVRLTEETHWLTLFRMTALFQRDKSVISRHQCNAFFEDEVERHSY